MKTLENCKKILVEGLDSIHKLITATATATNFMSIGTGDRAGNEQYRSQKSSALLTRVLNEEDKERYEHVNVESP